MWKVPLFKIYHDYEDLKQVKKVLQRGSYWAIGPEIEKFENELARFVGTKFAVVFNSGTSALHAILMALEIKKGSNVVVPSFTFISTANSVLFVDANPIFVDIENKNFGMDPKHLEKIVSQYKINAIIPVHFAGKSCNIEEIIKIAKTKNIPVIEDAAESLGAKRDGKMIGSFGDASILSFAQNKIISTGEGGAVLTNSKRIFEKLLLLRSHGRIDNVNYFSNPNKSEYIELGYNFRMPSMSAAIGISQLQKIKKIISMRQKVAKLYKEKLSDIPQIILPEYNSKITHVFQMYPIIVKDGNRDKLLNFLKKSGIMSKVYFEPVHQTSYYKKRFRKNIKLPVTESVSRDILSLPIYPHMNKKEINLVTTEVKRFFDQC